PAFTELAAEFQQLRQVFIQEGSGALSQNELRMVQNLIGELRIGGEALQSELLQAAAHPPDGLHPSGGVGQDLGCHRVVVRRQLAPAVQAGVHPHAGAAGEMEEIHPSGAGAEPLHRVFGVDAALDGMALERHILLPQAQRQAGGNPQLLAH
ncbi:Secondary thiamine-phosphate synthase enzyme, partial [Dysosmobacter welbionis]